MKPSHECKLYNWPSPVHLAFKPNAAIIKAPVNDIACTT